MEINKITYDYWTEDWKLMETKGGAHVVHARGCSMTEDWDISGCREVNKYKRDKHKICKCCANLVYLTVGAKDYIKNLDRYKKHLNGASRNLLEYMFIDKRAKCEFYGEKLYIKCKADNWYIDFSLDDVRLFHNNYNTKSRDNNDWVAAGYHEHDIYGEAKEDKLRTMLYQISHYDYDEASKNHEAKRKARPKVTFKDLDAEYYSIK